MNDREFEQLVKQLHPRLTATAERILKGGLQINDNTEDAVQETFIRLWHMGEKLNTCHNIEALAITIIRNICIDILRHPVPPIDSIENIQVLTECSADTSLNTESIHCMIDHYICQLPTTQQRLIKMRSEGMTLDEIAAICQMPKNSIKTLIARARKTLLVKMKRQ